MNRDRLRELLNQTLFAGQPHPEGTALYAFFEAYEEETKAEVEANDTAYAKANVLAEIWVLAKKYVPEHAGPGVANRITAICADAFKALHEKNLATVAAGGGAKALSGKSLHPPTVASLDVRVRTLEKLVEQLHAHHTLTPPRNG